MEHDLLMHLNRTHVVEAAENGIGKHIWRGTGTGLCGRLARMNDIWLQDIGQLRQDSRFSPNIDKSRYMDQYYNQSSARMFCFYKYAGQY
jgi:hypothetical protein